MADSLTNSQGIALQYSRDYLRPPGPTLQFLEASEEMSHRRHHVDSPVDHEGSKREIPSQASMWTSVPTSTPQPFVLNGELMQHKDGQAWGTSKDEEGWATLGTAASVTPPKKQGLVGSSGML